MLIFTARYIPVGRVVVNLSAGATGFSIRRFTILDVLGCITWAGYSVAIGVVAGGWFHDNKLLGIVLSVALAICLGYLIDKIVHALLKRFGRKRDEPMSHATHLLREDPRPLPVKVPDAEEPERRNE